MIKFQDQKLEITKYKNVSIEQYYIPEHHYNIENILTQTKNTITYCTENFDSFPFDHVRIAEIPNHWPFGGMATPGTIVMVENQLYLYTLAGQRRNERDNCQQFLYSNN